MRIQTTDLIAKHMVLCLVAAALLVGCDDEDGGSTTLDDTGSTADGTDGSTSGATDTLPDSDTSGATTCFTLSDGSCVEETFRNPPVLTPDENGVHHLTLAPTEFNIDGQRHCVRAYNGSFLAPTIETPARVGNTARQVYVDLVNGLSDHDYRSLGGDDTCACKDSAGAECVPAHIHDRCIDPTLSDCTCTNSEGEECEHMFDFNVTNLHAHGSHIRPDYSRGGEACEPYNDKGIPVRCRECGDETCDGNITDDTCYSGDNVLNTVHPGEGARYRWDIDEDGTHHTGLQWYHPHIHGTTAMQVSSGAAGAWIVRGELDSLDGIKDAKERVIVFSTPSIATEDGFQPLADGETCDEDHITFNNFATLGAITASQMNVINGQHVPRMITPPNQVERWRILQTGFLDEAFFGLFRGTDANCTDWSTAEEDTIQLTQIARDGLILPQSFEYPFVFMSPGYRVEAMLGGQDKLKDGETWCLVVARFLQEGNASIPGGGEPFSPMNPPDLSDVLTRFDTNGQAVAILNVTADAGAPTETQLPDYAEIAALAPPVDVGGASVDARCAEAATKVQTDDIDQVAVLQVGFFTQDLPDPCGCPNYNVNCRNFESTDRSKYAFDRDLPLGSVEHWRVTASFDGHPFHIHINPYIVCPNENIFDPMPFAHWRDTYLVNIGRSIDLITQNKTFTGPYVFHCHKLTHEDHGMMELIRVCDPATDTTCGDYSWENCEAGDSTCTKARAATECAVEANGPLEIEACTAALGAPGAACDVNACTSNSDCDTAERCDIDTCVPAPCAPPCGPGTTCVHGVCE